MEQQFQYHAFISYKRQDEKWAKWLQNKLESYRLPATLCKANPHLPKRLSPTFRDNTDLRPGVLTEVLEENLRQSKYLIVVCSPLSAESKWVGREIEYFISQGKEKRILLFIIDGEAYSDVPGRECVHTVIKKYLPETLGVNINEAGNEWKYVKREKAFIRMVSTMLDLRFDILWKRQKRRLTRHLFAATAILFFFFFSLSFVWQANQPFDARITLREISPQNSGLPVATTGGTITLKLDNQQLSDTLYGIDETALFPNLPAKYQRKAISLSFSSPGFHPLDTVVTLSRELSLSICRDENYFGRVAGIVRNENDDKPVAAASVDIASRHAVSDTNGYFELFVPLAKQNTEYKASISYQGKKMKEQTVFPAQNNSKLINTLYTR